MDKLEKLNIKSIILRIVGRNNYYEMQGYGHYWWK